MGGVHHPLKENGFLCSNAPKLPDREKRAQSLGSFPTSRFGEFLEGQAQVQVTRAGTSKDIVFNVHK